MGANAKELRIRIRSVDSMLHMTKAMGLVASSKIRRTRTAMEVSREYRDSVQALIDQLMCTDDCASSPFRKAASEGGRTKYIVIAGDRGLAGGYNNNVFRMAAGLGISEDDILPIGKRAADRWRTEGYPSAEGFGVTDGAKLADRLCEEYLAGEFERLCIVYTKYRNVLVQEPQLVTLLPLEPPKEKTAASSVVFEPDPLTVLNVAVREYLSGMIFWAVRESFASEVAARRTAMDSASKNAQEMIDNLNLEFNRVRQGAITQEITEIVAGSN